MFFQFLNDNAKIYTTVLIMNRLCFGTDDKSNYDAQK